MLEVLALREGFSFIGQFFLYSETSSLTPLIQSMELSPCFLFPSVRSCSTPSFLWKKETKDLFEDNLHTTQNWKSPFLPPDFPSPILFVYMSLKSALVL